jgi:hypothetical protein
MELSLYLRLQAQRPLSIEDMLYEEAKSRILMRRGEALSHSPTHVAHWTNAKDPPPYGAQHHQEALWEGKQPPCDTTHQLNQLEAGGNGALPPRWQQFKALNGSKRYQDDTLVMMSSNRPLPGVRLGEQRKSY